MLRIVLSSILLVVVMAGCHSHGKPTPAKGNAKSAPPMIDARMWQEWRSSMAEFLAEARGAVTAIEGNAPDAEVKSKVSRVRDALERIPGDFEVTTNEAEMARAGAAIKDIRLILDGIEVAPFYTK